jgi:hypothetical protein
MMKQHERVLSNYSCSTLPTRSVVDVNCDESANNSSNSSATRGDIVREEFMSKPQAKISVERVLQFWKHDECQNKRKFNAQQCNNTSVGASVSNTFDSPDTIQLISAVAKCLQKYAEGEAIAFNTVETATNYLTDQHPDLPPITILTEAVIDAVHQIAQVNSEGSAHQMIIDGAMILLTTETADNRCTFTEQGIACKLGPVSMVDAETHQILRIYPSVDSAAEALSCQSFELLDCINGHTTTSKGFQWKLYEGPRIDCKDMICVLVLSLMLWIFLSRLVAQFPHGLERVFSSTGVSHSKPSYPQVICEVLSVSFF